MNEQDTAKQIKELGENIAESIAHTTDAVKDIRDMLEHPDTQAKFKRLAAELRESKEKKTGETLPGSES